MICPILIFSLCYILLLLDSFETLLWKRSQTSPKATLKLYLFPNGGQYWMSRQGYKDRTTLLSCSAGALVFPSAASGSVPLGLRRCLGAAFSWAELANLWFQISEIHLAANQLLNVLFWMSLFSWSHTTGCKILSALVPACWNSSF